MVGALPVSTGLLSLRRCSSTGWRLICRQLVCCRALLPPSHIRNQPTICPPNPCNSWPSRWAATFAWTRCAACDSCCPIMMSRPSRRRWQVGSGRRCCLSGAMAVCWQAQCWRSEWHGQPARLCKSAVGLGMRSSSSSSSSSSALLSRVHLPLCCAPDPPPRPPGRASAVGRRFHRRRRSRCPRPPAPHPQPEPCRCWWRRCSRST